MYSIRFVLAAFILSLSLGTTFGAEPLALKGHTKSVTALAWAADGKSLVSAGDDRTIRTWDTVTGKQTASLTEIAREGYGGPVVAFSPDLKRAAINYWGEVTIRNVADGKKVGGFDPILDRGEKFVFRPDVYAMAFSPDGKSLATAGSRAAVGGRHGLPGGVVAVWDAATGKVKQRFPNLSTGAGAVVWSPDGKLVAAGTTGAGGELPDAGEVMVWQAASGQTDRNFSVKATVEQGEWASAADVAFSPDGKKLAVPVTAGGWGTPGGLLIEETGSAIRVWDLEKAKSSQPIKDLKAAVGRLAYSPNGRQLATAGTDKIVRVWDLTNGKELAALTCTARIGVIAFSPKGDSLAAACADGLILIWALPAGK